MHAVEWFIISGGVVTAVGLGFLAVKGDPEAKEANFLREQAVLQAQIDRRAQQAAEAQYTGDFRRAPRDTTDLEREIADLSRIKDHQQRRWYVREDLEGLE